jgi:hypothetical protein
MGAHPLEARVCARASHLVVLPLHDQFGVGEGLVAPGMILVEMRTDQVVDVARCEAQRRQLVDDIVASRYASLLCVALCVSKALALG